jgi:hypothetical protein
VTTDARGVIQKSNEPGLHRRAIDLHMRPVERVGLPHFIGVRFPPDCFPDGGGGCAARVVPDDFGTDWTAEIRSGIWMNVK